MRKRTFVVTISVLVIIGFMSLLFAAYASAKTAEELLQTPGLNSTERAAIAEAIAKATPVSSLPTTLKGMVEWREMGDAFAQTIKTICHTLNVEVNAFLTSDVGKLTAAVIIYKMVGKDILQIILYTGIWIGVTFFMMVSIKFLHMKRKVKKKVKDPEVKDEDKAGWIIVTDYVDRFGSPVGSDDDQYWKMASLFVHIIAWFIFSCIIAYSVI